MKGKLSLEDLRLWQSQLKSVKPLAKTIKVLESSPFPKEFTPSRSPHCSLEVKKGILTPPPPLQQFGRKELRHLKIDGRLDLHGMTIEQGYDALEQFLVRAQKRGFKVVLVITGKGAVSAENTLRRQLPRWIKERHVCHLVSGFHSPAKQQDGGQGACYIGVRKPSSSIVKKIVG